MSGSSSAKSILSGCDGMIRAWLFASDPALSTISTGFSGHASGHGHRLVSKGERPADQSSFVSMFETTGPPPLACLLTVPFLPPFHRIATCFETFRLFSFGLVSQTIFLNSVEQFYYCLFGCCVYIERFLLSPFIVFEWPDIHQLLYDRRCMGQTSRAGS